MNNTTQHTNARARVAHAAVGFISDAESWLLAFVEHRIGIDELCRDLEYAGKTAAKEARRVFESSPEELAAEQRRDKASRFREDLTFRIDQAVKTWVETGDDEALAKRLQLLPFDMQLAVKGGDA